VRLPQRRPGEPLPAWLDEDWPALATGASAAAARA